MKLKLVYLFHTIFCRLEISIAALKAALLPMEVFFILYCLLISASKITGFSNIPIQLQKNIWKMGKNVKQTKSANWPNKKLPAAILGMEKKTPHTKQVWKQFSATEKFELRNLQSFIYI